MPKGKGKCVKELQLQGLYPGLREDERLQLDAFAQEISSGDYTDWLQKSTPIPGYLVEACNESARLNELADIDEFAQHSWTKSSCNTTIERDPFTIGHR